PASRRRGSAPPRGACARARSPTGSPVFVALGGSRGVGWVSTCRLRIRSRTIHVRCLWLRIGHALVTFSMTPRFFPILNEPNNAGGIGYRGRERGRLGPSPGARRPLRPRRGTIRGTIRFRHLTGGNSRSHGTHSGRCPTDPAGGMGGVAGRACVAGMPCEIARPRSEDVSENGGANRGRVRHPLLLPIPDDARGHRPGYFDELLLRVDARSPR